MQKTRHTQQIHPETAQNQDIRIDGYKNTEDTQKMKQTFIEERWDCHLRTAIVTSTSTILYKILTLLIFTAYSDIKLCFMDSCSN